MRIRRHIGQRAKPCVLTIGNFDGVHLGHEAVLKQLIAEAERRALPSVVMIFEPHPLEYFLAEKAPARLTELREKVCHFTKLGIDEILVIAFNSGLANLPAKDFIKQILVAGLAAQYLLVGDDFRFGKDRQGDFALLQKLAPHYGLTVEDSQSHLLDGQRVSSTAVRQCLAVQDLKAARRLLGRAFTIGGRVVYGAQRGRDIGFPTANIGIRRLVLPLQGVFAVRVEDEAGMIYSGVANIGKRPTVDGIKNSLEVHLFDFDGKLYGKHLTVEFVHGIRGEKKFASLEDLKHQIQKDVEQAKVFFNLS